MVSIGDLERDQGLEPAFDGASLWQGEMARFTFLAIMGAATSYLSVNIPHTEVFFDVRFIFGFMGFALLRHWWTALLLAGTLSLAGFHKVSWEIALIGNMMYTLPNLVVIRLVHARVLSRIRHLVWYGAAWLSLILLCYQLFTTPIIWGFMAFLQDAPIWPAMLEAWCEQQPFLIESLMVGGISALGMMLVRSNAATRASKQELATTLYSIGDGVIATDTEGKVQRMNPVAERLTGWSEEEALGKPLETVFCIRNEKTRERVESPVAQVQRKDTVIGLANHTLLISRDGTERPIVDSAAPIRNGNNQIAGVVLIFRDQSEERATRRKLEESNERLLLALRNARMGVWDWNLDTDQVNWYGEHSSLLGIPIEAFGNTIDDVLKNIHPDDRERSKDIFSRTVETGADFENTYRVVWSEDKERWMHSYGKLAYDDGGEPRRVVGTIQDITERKRAREERERLAAQIREQALQLEQILATVPEGVLLLNAEGHVLQANPVAEKALTVLARASEGDLITQLGDRQLAELLTSPPTKGLWHEVKAGGRTFEAIARPMKDGVKPEHWVLVVKEVTQEREIKAQLQQQERLAAVGQLAAGIAHDFNNIMATIVLYAQIAARSEGLSGRDRERMAMINQQAWHATRLIERILDFSRRSMLEKRSLDLLLLLKEQVELLNRTLPEHIKIELEYGKEDYTIHADPTRMQQMLTNLAVNARDAMPDGGELSIRLERATVERGKSPILPEIEAGEWVRLKVSDTGTGISPDVLPHIFEPFFTTKGPGEGSGLGLAQVHGIVGQHGGRIDVETKVNEGTTITIYLPVPKAPSSEPLPSVVSTTPQGQGELVLVVEDNKTVRKALVTSLERLNYRILEAANGQEALKIVKDKGEQIALVLSDVVMPVMGGIALFQRLKDQGWQKPILLLTGHSMDKELEGLREQGLNDWLPKPPSLERLARLIDEALN